MTRRACVSVIVAGLVTAAAGQQPVFRAGTRPVPVYATVTDAAGRLVADLDRTDFRVLDNGVPVEVTTFSSDALPITVALMLDMSDSMAAERTRIRDAAVRFVEALYPEDRVRIGTFGDEIAVSPWLTGDKAVLTRILHEEVWPGGGTPLWSAMRAGMTSLAREQGRRVVLTLSDGVDLCPLRIRRGFTPSIAPLGRAVNSPIVLTTPVDPCATFREVERVVREQEFMTYAIGLEGPGIADSLSGLARETGGGYFELKRNADLPGTFNRVADELHHQYLLAFTPPTLDGKLHTLEVQILKPGLTARARRSYLASASR